MKWKLRDFAKWQRMKERQPSSKEFSTVTTTTKKAEEKQNIHGLLEMKWFSWVGRGVWGRGRLGAAQGLSIIQGRLQEGHGSSPCGWWGAGSLGMQLGSPGLFAGNGVGDRGQTPMGDFIYPHPVLYFIPAQFSSIWSWQQPWLLPAQQSENPRAGARGRTSSGLPRNQGLIIKN